MRSLICAFDVRIGQKQVFSWQGSILFFLGFISVYMNFIFVDFIDVYTHKLNIKP